MGLEEPSRGQHQRARRARWYQAGVLAREDVDNRSTDYAMRRVEYADGVVEHHHPLRPVVAAEGHHARLAGGTIADGVGAFAPDLYGRLVRDLAVVIRHRYDSRQGLAACGVGDEVKALLGVVGVRLTTDVLAALRTTHRASLAAWIATQELGYKLDVRWLDRVEAA